MAKVKPDLYKALGLNRDADPAMVRAAYRRAAKKAHPDTGGSSEKFAIIKLAAETLGDAKRRKHYDATGEAEEAPVDITEAQACNFVMEAISGVLNRAEHVGRDFDKVDIVESALITINGKMAELKTAIKNVDAVVKKLEKVAARFHAKKTKTNRINPMILAQIDQHRRTIAVNEATVLVVTRSKEILLDHDYDFDRPSDASRAALAALMSKGW
jgi:curved DNA-binding protein CbpA